MTDSSVKIKWTVLLLSVLSLLCLSTVAAAATQAINFTEILRDKDGNLLNDDRDVFFNIYTKGDNTPEEWSFHRKVRFDKGRFTVSIPQTFFDGSHDLMVTVFKDDTVTKTTFVLPRNFTLPEYLVISLGALFILFFAFVKFNTWTQDRGEDYRLPPRYFTTFKRYFTYAVVYVFLTELIFFIIVFAPDFILSVSPSLGGQQDKTLVESFKNNSVLWAVFILTGILPNFPWINRLELKTREFFHQMAFIPYQAKSAIDEFLNDPKCFKADPKVIHTILESQKDQFDKYDFLKQDNSFFHRWCKIHYLLERIRHWDQKGSAFQKIGLNPIETPTFLDELSQLKKDMTLYKRQARPSSSPGDIDAYTDWLETRIDARMNRLLTKIYTHISCNILSTEKIPQNRLKSYKFFGLYPKDSEKTFIDLDTILCSVFFILISILLPSLLSLSAKKILLLQSTTLSNGRDILLWVVYGVAMHGLTILLTSTLLKILYTHRFVALNNKITIRTISSMIGYMTGLVIIVAGHYLRFHNTEFFSSSTFLWPIITAITGCYIAYHLETTIPEKRSPFGSAFQQGLVTGTTAFVICLLLETQDALFFTTAVLIGFSVGFSIGFIYPFGYKNREKLNLEMKDCGRSMHRFECAFPIRLQKGEREIPCQTIDINVNSVKLASSIDLPENSRFDIVFSNSLKVPGILLRKAANSAVLKLMYTDRRTGRMIQAFIDQNLTSYA